MLLRMLKGNAMVLSAKYGAGNWARRMIWQKKLGEGRRDWAESSDLWEIEEGIQNLTRQDCISKSMAIGQFVNPQVEEVDDHLKVIVDEIAKAYSTGNRTTETDEEGVVYF